MRGHRCKYPFQYILGFSEKGKFIEGMKKLWIFFFGGGGVITKLDLDYFFGSFQAFS